MSQDQLRQIVGAYEALTDYLLRPYWGAKVAPPPEVTAALLEIRRLREGPVLNLEQNLVDGVWEAE